MRRTAVPLTILLILSPSGAAVQQGPGVPITTFIGAFLLILGAMGLTFFLAYAYMTGNLHLTFSLPEIDLGSISIPDIDLGFLDRSGAGLDQVVQDTSELAEVLEQNTSIANRKQLVHDIENAERAIINDDYDEAHTHLQNAVAAVKGR